MCKAAPGARCSGHTEKQLTSKKASRVKVQEKLDSATLNANKAASANRDASFRKYNNEAKRLQGRITVLDVEIAHLQRDYDGTPKGQSELRSLMNSPETSSEDYNDANARIAKGSALRSLRNNLLDIQVSGRKSSVRKAILGLDDGEFGEERTVAAA